MKLYRDALEVYREIPTYRDSGISLQTLSGYREIETYRAYRETGSYREM